MKQCTSFLAHVSRRIRHHRPFIRLSSNTNSPSVPRFIKIVEVGPRDGLQNESKFVPTQDKITFITKLAQAGCPFIETTSFVSPKWVPQMSDSVEVLEGIRSRYKEDPFMNLNVDIGDSTRKTVFSCLVPNLQGMKRAVHCGADEVAIFTSASEAFSKQNINCSIDRSFDRFRDVIAMAMERDIPVRGYVSCVLGCPYQGHVSPDDVARTSERLVQMGCYEISLGDTIGVGTPGHVLPMLHAVQKVVDTNMIAVHFHDTYGQALANIYAAISEGISTVDSSVAGLGGCPYASGASGNVATEDVLYMLQGMDIRTGIDLHKLIEAGKFICDVLGHPTRSRVATALAGNEHTKE